ncbi:MAG: hypothetical protein D6702_06305 [Planctomycetota bacterium]|nr:MAG: hypothetical protein D6702_06305 [Planctomycetota bacterium]
MEDGADLRAAARVVFLAAGVLTVMIAAAALTGVDPQRFERALPPPIWNGELAAATGPMRAILVLDQLFVIAFATGLVLAARALARRRPHPLAFLASGAILAAAGCDLMENLHLLVGIRHLSAEPGDLWASRASLEAWSLVSLAKWALAWLGLSAFLHLIPRRKRLGAGLAAVVSLLVPVGIWASFAPAAAARPWEALRALLMLAGFLLLGATLRAEAGVASPGP